MEPPEPPPSPADAHGPTDDRAGRRRDSASARGRRRANPAGHPNAHPPLGRPDDRAPYGHADDRTPYGHADERAPYVHVDERAPYVHADERAPYGRPDERAPYGRPDERAPYGRSEEGAPYGRPEEGAPYGRPDEHGPSGRLDGRAVDGQGAYPPSLELGSREQGDEYGAPRHAFQAAEGWPDGRETRQPEPPRQDARTPKSGGQAPNSPRGRARKQRRGRGGSAAERAREPRGHWVLMALGSLALITLLLLDGFANGAVGESPKHEPKHEPAPAPADVMSGGPVVNLAGGTPHSLRTPPKTIALTFDDGPDPKWTPKLLDVLKRHGAHATFFSIGAHIAQQPAIVKRMLAEGNEIGSHTYTHVDMASAPAWRNRLELDLTQRALAGAAGVHTRLIRMPYSSVPNGLTAPEWRAAQQAGKDGYLVVLTDRDTEDWQKPGVDKIVQAALAAEKGGRGAIVMLHDAGGDRTETVAAVEQMIVRLQARGYRFTTVSQAMGLPPADVPATGSEKAIGWTLVAAQRTASALTGWMQLLFMIAGVLCAVRLAVLLVFAHVHRQRARRSRLPENLRAPSGPGSALNALGEPTGPDAPPSVTVIVPAYNEEAGIAATVRSLLDTDYPGPLEVIVVDDGSTDRTAEIVERLALPSVRLMRKPNGGKPGALNVGIAASYGEILVLVDGDTVFQRDTIRNLVAPLAADPSVGAVSGNTKVANRRGLLGQWQHLEYVIGFNLDRRMFDVARCMPTIPGAIGAFRRRTLVSVGGVPTDTLAEDTDLTMAICRGGWRVVYAEHALAWTEVPSSLRQLWRQRYRWCYGTLQAMWKHRGALVERGPFGRRCLIYLTAFQVILPLFAPAVDLFALFGLFFMDPVAPIAMWALFAGAQVAAGGYALWLDGEKLRPLWTMPLQQVVYRQLLYLVVVQSVVTALLGTRLRWHTIRRTGTFGDAGLGLGRDTDLGPGPPAGIAAP
ncbi:glycosyltransferase [Actinomadura gamaensis]|uniref:Glycosyltransferase n=1 Tax=Actinomadura gamaensis TaxID=1763541 RepID=A0ABV9TYJ6_9ACTN